MATKLDNNQWDFIGLSTEDKPTNDDGIYDVRDGCCLYEVDTKNLYIYYQGAWYNQTEE